MLADLWSYRQLIYSLTRHEIVGQFKYSILGISWSFITPLFMLTFYTFVFSQIFHPYWQFPSTSLKQCAIIIYIGLIIHRLFSDILVVSPSIISEQAFYLKKNAFPYFTLPLPKIGNVFF